MTKNNILRVFFLAGFFVGSAALAADKLKVVATTPDLADIAQHIGGEYIDVTSLATGVEDPHSVPMKPSFAVLLNRSDVVLLQGLGLEHTFLPGLLDASRNPKIQPDMPGYVDCSVHILPLEVPTRLDRSLGEQHPLGNPHFNLDPNQGKKIARAIQEGLERNLPEHAAEFKINREKFDAELDQAIARWTKEGSILKGIKYVSYHPDFIYLGDWLGMVQAGTIELKAGVDATPSHIVELEESMKRSNVELVIRERHYPATLAETVAAQTGATLIELPIMTRGVPEAKDYITFIDYNISKLIEAVQSRKGGKR